MPVLILAVEALRRGAPLVRDYVRQLEGLRADQDRQNARLVAMLSNALGISDPHGFVPRPDDDDNHDEHTAPVDEAAKDRAVERRRRRRRPT